MALEAINKGNLGSNLHFRIATTIAPKTEAAQDVGQDCTMLDLSTRTPQVAGSDVSHEFDMKTGE